MNDEPKSIWKRPLTGRLRWLAWLALYAVVVFIIVGFVLTLGNPEPVGELILRVSIIALIALALVLLSVRFLRWLCCRRNFLRFAFGAACFITLILLAYAVENWRGKSAWTRHRREWPDARQA